MSEQRIKELEETVKRLKKAVFKLYKKLHSFDTDDYMSIMNKKDKRSKKDG